MDARTEVWIGGFELSQMDFAITGMTCAACAARVERALGNEAGSGQRSCESGGPRQQESGITRIKRVRIGLWK